MGENISVVVGCANIRYSGSGGSVAIDVGGLKISISVYDLQSLQLAADVFLSAFKQTTETD